MTPFVVILTSWCRCTAFWYSSRGSLLKLRPETPPHVKRRLSLCSNPRILNCMLSPGDRSDPTRATEVAGTHPGLQLAWDRPRTARAATWGATGGTWWARVTREGRRHKRFICSCGVGSWRLPCPHYRSNDSSSPRAVQIELIWICVYNHRAGDACVRGLGQWVRPGACDVKGGLVTVVPSPGAQEERLRCAGCGLLTESPGTRAAWAARS